MKKLLLALMAAVSLSGCVMYADSDAFYPAYTEGCTTVCDDYGCREVCGRYFYSGGVAYYWDAHFGCWIGPRGYYHGGVFYHGYHPGYHTYYHRGYYYHGRRR
jgi:hypothetical protein